MLAIRNDCLPTSVFGALSLAALLLLCGCSSQSNAPSLFADQSGLSVGQQIKFTDNEQTPDLQRAFSDDATAVVVCVMSTECDATGRVLSRLKTLSKRKSSVLFVGFATSEADHLSQFLQDNALGFDVFGDFEHEVAHLLGATRTPAFFVFDAKRVLRYRGPLDDATLTPQKASQPWLASAIDAVLGNQEIQESRNFVGKPVLGEF